jgi:hypothetical protein
MSTWATVFLGVIAVTTLLTAITQIVLLLAAARLVRRITALVDDLDREIRPIIGHISNIARDASRVATMAVAQVERADQVLADAATKIEQTLAGVQTMIVNTLREGNALMAGFRAVMTAIRAFQGRQGRRRSDDDDALFI